MAGFKFFGYTVWKSWAEKEIHTLFETHETTLAAQKQRMCDDITEWGSRLVHTINEYTNKQKDLLEQEYRNQIRFLNQKHNQFVEELHVHEQLKKNIEVNQLLDQCKSLQFELAAFEHYNQTLPFIAVPYKEPKISSRDDFHIIESESDKFANSSSNTNDAEYNTSTDSKSDSDIPCLTFPRSDTESSRTNSDDVYNDSASSNGDQKFHDTKEYDLLEKCPICFMIFPSTMTGGNRSKHVHEHYQDDE